MSSTKLILDERPIELHGFKLRARSARPVGRPTIEQWSAAMQFATSTYDATPYWVGDLLNYGESRKDWSEKLDQAMETTGLARHTLTKLAYIARRTDADARRMAPSISHAEEVAALEPPAQKQWLNKATAEGWTKNELRQHLRASQRRNVIEGQAELEGMFRIIYADPPWSYTASTPTADAGKHYPSMTMQEIADLPVQAHSMTDSILFMWVTATVLFENPGPRDVMEAWGFEYKSNRVWDKVIGLPGHYGMQVKHEHLIIGTRGSCLPDVPTPHDDSVLVQRRSDVHSEKPEEVRQWIDRHWTFGPRVELFAREKHKGWHVFGNDARLWSKGD